MSILIANLKHLYQRRWLLVIHLLFGWLACEGIWDLVEDPVAGEGASVGLIVLAFAAGYLLATILIEVLTKPFSYCLPGHKRVLRKYVLLAAAPVSCLFSIPFLVYPGLSSWGLLVAFCSAFFAQLTVYLFGAMLAFGIKKSAAVVFWFILFDLIGNNHFDLHVILERVILEYPHAVICVGMLGSAGAWLWLGKAHLARRFCDVRWLGILDCFNPAKMNEFKKFERARRAKGHPRPWVERLFLGRMDKHEHFGVGRYLWGVLYSNFAIPVSRWKIFAVAVISLTIFSGYFIQGMIFAVIVPPLAIFGQQRPVAYSSMLVFGGRREKFVSTVVLSVVGIAAACAIVLVMVGLSGLLAGLMPEIALKDGARKLAFRIIDVRFVFVPLVASPFFLTLRLVFYRRAAISIFLFALLAWPLMMAMMVPQGIFPRHIFMEIITNRASVFGIAVVGWAVFFLVLSHICYERCLVGQGCSR